MDEPTTGLHLDDIRKLVLVLDRLVAAGHTLVLIEHNLDVVKLADWIIDLGPEGGSGGGKLVGMGRPEDIVRIPESHTGRWLAPLLTRGAPVREAPAASQRTAPTGSRKLKAG
jgi:excinuclease ABC subunit A